MDTVKVPQPSSVRSQDSYWKQDLKWQLWVEHMAAHTPNTAFSCCQLLTLVCFAAFQISWVWIHDFKALNPEIWGHLPNK